MPQDVLNLIPEPMRSEPSAAARVLVGNGAMGKVVILFSRHSLNRPLVWQRRWIHGNLQGIRQQMSGAYGISYALSGEAWLYRDGQKHKLIKPGMLYQLMSMPDENTWNLKPVTDFFECVFYFDADTGRRLEKLGLWNPDVGVTDVGLRPSIITAYVRMYERILDQSQSSGSVFRDSMAFLEQLYACIRNAPSQTSFAVRARRLLRENPHPGFSMQDAADAMKMNYNAFRRQFKRELGLAPGEYQMKVRMDRARELLRNHSVKETAVLLGYSDEFCFSNQFKKAVGAPPKEYQR